MVNYFRKVALALECCRSMLESCPARAHDSKAVEDYRSPRRWRERECAWGRNVPRDREFGAPERGSLLTPPQSAGGVDSRLLYFYEESENARSVVYHRQPAPLRT